MGVSRLPAPPAPDLDRRWAPFAPIAISVVSAAVSATGALLVGGPDENGRVTGPFVYLAGMFGLVFAVYRAVWSRARHFAAQGVPEEWTRPPLRGLRAANLRRWDAAIREMREPWPDERDDLLVAARARAEGLLSIEVPAGLAVLGCVAMVVLAARSPSVMAHYVVRGYLIPIVLVWFVVRLDVVGARAQAFLDRFGRSSK